MGCPVSLHVQRVFGEVCELRQECKGAAHYHKAPLRYTRQAMLCQLQIEQRHVRHLKLPQLSRRVGVTEGQE